MIALVLVFGACEELQEATEKVDDKPIEQPIGDNEPIGTPIIDGNIAIPTGLTVAAVTSTSITLTWTASSNTAVTGYKLYQTLIPTIRRDGSTYTPPEERKKNIKRQ